MRAGSEFTDLKRQLGEAPVPGQLQSLQTLTLAQLRRNLRQTVVAEVQLLQGRQFT